MIPVILHNGFLDAGKTTFINSVLKVPGDEPHKTLILVFEEGEEEFATDKFIEQVMLEYVSEEDFTRKNLTRLVRESGADRIIIEYNGMWLREKLLERMPQNWAIAQEFAIFDATTFEMYNKNMRQLCFDKMKWADIVIFNRTTPEADKMPLHREVRIANRKAYILYEYGPYDMEPDEIEDPLPYEKSASKIVVEDDWFAEWYADMNDKPEDYDGKTIEVKGIVALSAELPAGKFAFGRPVMTCCVEDIEFAGTVAVYAAKDDLKVGDWVKITAKLRVEYEEAYGEKGPVLYVKKLEKCEPADPEVATF